MPHSTAAPFFFLISHYSQSLCVLQALFVHRGTKYDKRIFDSMNCRKHIEATIFDACCHTRLKVRTQTDLLTIIMQASAAASITEKLTHTVVGRYLSPEQIHKFVDASQSIELRVGQLLFREGQIDNHLYVMLKGQIDLVMQVRHRGSQRILSLGSGDLVAWSALLGSGVMTCSAICLRDARLIAINAKAVAERMEQDHEFGYHFMRMVAMALAHRLTATRLQLLDLFAPASSNGT
jgi:CRP-like cAMP-binding protein